MLPLGLWGRQGRVVRAHCDGPPPLQHLSGITALLPCCTSILLGSLPSQLFFSLGAACPHALKPSAQGVPSWQDADGQAADSAQGSQQAVQCADRHLHSTAALAARAARCQAARSLPSGGFPVTPARVSLLGGLTAAGYRTGKSCVASSQDSGPGNVCENGSPHPGSTQRGLGRSQESLQGYRTLCRDASWLGRSPSSFLGSLLQLSGALMLCLARCLDPACYSDSGATCS